MTDYTKLAADAREHGTAPSSYDVRPCCREVMNSLADAIDELAKERDLLREIIIDLHCACVDIESKGDDSEFVKELLKLTRSALAKS